MVKKNIQKKIPSFMSDKIEANSLSVNGDDAQLKRTRSKISKKIISFLSFFIHIVNIKLIKSYLE